MSIFNSIVTSALPFLPKWFAKPFARPYVAGENMDEALEQIKTLNQKGFSATIDILGEHTKTIDLAATLLISIAPFMKKSSMSHLIVQYQ